MSPMPKRKKKPMSMAEMEGQLQALRDELAEVKRRSEECCSRLDKVEVVVAGAKELDPDLGKPGTD